MKRKYLLRLLMIMISLVFVPSMLVSMLFLRNSLNQLRETNDAYYEKTLESYANILNEMITEMRDRAAFISAESKESESNLLEGATGLEGDYFRLFMVAKELEDMNPYIDASDWGIYLYDIDKILRPSKTANVEDIIFGIEELGQDSSEIEEFFSVDNYKWSKEVFCTTNNDENGTGTLLMGVYTHIGTYNDKAMVYFAITPQDMEQAMTLVDKNHIGFQLYNENTQKTMLSWGTRLDAEVQNSLARETTLPGIRIVAHLYEDTLQQNLYEYASNMIKVMTILGIVLFLCCLGGVYISYKPIKQLTNEIDYEEETDEIDAIINAMERDRSIIKEQEQTITDLLLSHLLYGGHISASRIKRLGIEEDMNYYCVFLLKGQVLDRSKAKEFVSVAEQMFDSRLFVIHLVEEQRTVFVVFSKTEDCTGLYEYLKQWMEQHDIEENMLYAGKVVEQINDIQLSFRTCLARERRVQEATQKQGQENGTETKAEKQKKLIEDILSYLELNYRDANLGQVQVADEFNISNYTLSRIFKNQVGIGFSEYLISKRIDCAKRLLLTSEYSINEIATMCGFTSVHYFSRMFKASQDVTPSAFRKGFVQNVEGDCQK